MSRRPCGKAKFAGDRAQTLVARQQRCVPGEARAGKFADDERVTYDHAGIEQRDEFGIAAAQVIDPDRGIDQDHAPPRRLRIGSERRLFPTNRRRA